MNREQARPRDLPMYRRNGTKTGVACDGAPVRDPKRRINEASLAPQEITAEAQAREKAATEELISVNKRLAQSNRDLQRFAGVVAHDLHSPLATINTLSMWILKEYGDRLGEDGREYLTFLQNSVERMRALVDAVLKSSMDRYGDDLVAPIDCGKAMESVLRNLQGEIQAARASIRVDPLPVILGNEHRLEQVFQNLIFNAICYRRPDFHYRSVSPQPNRMANGSFAWKTTEWALKPNTARGFSSSFSRGLE